jgi:hypothetical protein
MTHSRDPLTPGEEYTVREWLKQVFISGCLALFGYAVVYVAMAIF